MHDFEFPGLESGTLSLRDFAEQPVLVVNTASACGFTPQYEDLQALWRDYRDRGLVVLGVPSNDFGGQEPGPAAAIAPFCTLHSGVDFPMTDKQTVHAQDDPPLSPTSAAARGASQAPTSKLHK